MIFQQGHVERGTHFKRRIQVGHPLAVGIVRTLHRDAAVEAHIQQKPVGFEDASGDALAIDPQHRKARGNLEALGPR